MTKVLEKKKSGFRNVAISLHVANFLERPSKQCRSLNRMGKEMEVLYEVKRRRFEYFGHINRNGKYRLLQLVMEGKIEGKRRPGRTKTYWLKNLRDWYIVS